MNDQNGKKRRLGDDDVDDSPTISSAEVMRMMKTMQEEIDSMKHRMNEMDGQLVQKTEEINSMKHKMNEMECQLLKTDQIESECNELRSHNANVVVPLLSQIVQATAQISTTNEITVKAMDDMKEMAKSTKNSLRFHRQLIDNTRWEYSAEPIANSYWVDNGHDQDDIDHITIMIQRMKDSTTAMRRECGVPSAGFHYGDDSDEGETFQWDEALHSHWGEFCESLSQYRHYLNQCPDNHGFSVYLCNIELEAPNRSTLLEKALKGIPFKDLTLHHNDSGYRLVSLVARVMKNTRQCEHLSLVGNQFEGIDNYTLGVYNVFWDTISDHPSLRRLNLSNCFNGSITGECHPALLGDALPKLSNLERIELKENRITGEKVTFIANFLRSNTCLVELDLSGNPINDEDAGVIADALASNNTLCSLAMVHGSPAMTEFGARALRKAVYDETSLNSIVDSNHVCHITSNWDLTECNFDIDPKENRKRKLLCALHRNRMLAAPDLIDRGLPADEGGLAQKLIPLVLESVQDSFYGDTSSLSLVYTIMKGWRMPLLYETSDGGSSSQRALSDED